MFFVGYVPAMFAVSYRIFDDGEWSQFINRILCGAHADDACEKDPDSFIRMLEPGEKLEEVWR